ncbi:glycoside hydrolase family 16 protein [Gonapodya prolifera JEL478]|uniref:Glycoside hydrolase family 16 protein n=1 Tax=Gonapodya prolifera (strain JEL478) TaxID=1344416 RepID=A0A139AMB1_GONPJ|nr:glycoside hydrolase family 16 protein [Gonapodya prolifera JEL478]|eukprot:KXS17595.1 glycoside hydrolase family 16 protein [Gonapodya prolifera JEL478]
MLRFLAFIALLGLFTGLPSHATSLPSARKFGHGNPQCVNYREDFSDPSVLTQIDSASTASMWINEEYPFSTATIEDGKLVLRLQLFNNYTNGLGKNEGSGATVSWNPWITTGRMCFNLKAAQGKGVVTAFVWSSWTDGQPVDDNLIWEWVDTLQSNYYAFGVDDPKPQVYVQVTDFATNYHTYCVERCQSFVSWTLDGVETYRLTLASVGNDLTKFPYRPGKGVFNIWDGGAGDAVISKWANGPTNWTDPNNPAYAMYVDWVETRCGCADDVASTAAASATGTSGISAVAAATGTAAAATGARPTTSASRSTSTTSARPGAAATGTTSASAGASSAQTGGVGRSFGVSALGLVGTLLVAALWL